MSRDSLALFSLVPYTIFIPQTPQQEPHPEALQFKSLCTNEAALVEFCSKGDATADDAGKLNGVFDTIIHEVRNQKLQLRTMEHAIFGNLFFLARRLIRSCSEQSRLMEPIVYFEEKLNNEKRKLLSAFAFIVQKSEPVLALKELDLGVLFDRLIYKKLEALVAKYGQPDQSNRFLFFYLCLLIKSEIQKMVALDAQISLATIVLASRNKNVFERRLDVGSLKAIITSYVDKKIEARIVASPFIRLLFTLKYQDKIFIQASTLRSSPALLVLLLRIEQNIASSLAEVERLIGGKCAELGAHYSRLSKNVVRLREMSEASPAAPRV